MNLAVDRQHIGAKRHHTGATGVEPCRNLAVDLYPRRGAQRRQNRLGVGLGIIQINRATRAERITRGGRTDQKAGRLKLLLSRFAAVAISAKPRA